MSVARAHFLRRVPIQSAPVITTYFVEKIILKACQMRMNLGAERISCMHWVHALAYAMAPDCMIAMALTGDTWILPWKVRVGL